MPGTPSFQQLRSFIPLAILIFRKKDGGISVVAKKRSAIGTFFDNRYKSKISDFRNAVVLLGYNAVRNAIVSISVINAFPKRVKLMDFDISQFWKHSLAVAVTSKNIAQLSKKESSDNCFVDVLLHDVGKVILAQYFPNLFETVRSTLQNEHLTFFRGRTK